MGRTVGAVPRQQGARVLTRLEGRSERTRALAAEEGFKDLVGMLRLLVRGCRGSYVVARGRLAGWHQAADGSGAAVVDGSARRGYTSRAR